MIAALLGLLAAAGGGQVAEAERLARQAQRLCAEPSGVAEGSALAARALETTAEFEPTVFVTAGRKGEVVEDAFLEARRRYRAHRAGVYEAVGECRARAGRHRAAARFLGRAVLLERTAARVRALARALLAEGRAAEALAALRPPAARPASALRPAADPPGFDGSPEWVRLVAEAVDAARLPSAQAEIDRWRIEALGLPHLRPVDGPVPLGPEPRLSTGAPFAWGEEPVLVYVARSACTECSAHLQQIRRTLGGPAGGPRPSEPPRARVVVLPEDADQDHALRQVLSLYRYDWPVLLGRGHGAALGVEPGTVLVVARRGWSAVAVKPPFDEGLAAALEALGRRDVQETPPRAGWNRRPPQRSGARAAEDPPAGALVPGEDEPPPAAFVAAADAYSAGRPLEALRFVESLQDKDDGWLLPPEARFNRALCLAALGDAAGARRLLLRIGDSRFQAAVDRTLEALPAKR